MIPAISLLSSGAATGTSGTSSTSGTASTASNIGAIGKDEFLRLLVTQLKNQDPMSPMDASQFATQLAQFSSVEQLMQLNTTVADQSTAVQTSTLAGQASLGASLIGRQVVAEGHQVVIPASGKADVRIDVSGSGGAATLTLTDADGKTVATRDLGKLPGGSQTVALPTDLPAGTYSYAISIKGSDATPVTVTTYTTGIVDAVEFASNQIVLRLGALKVALGSVAEIDPAPDSNTAARP